MLLKHLCAVGLPVVTDHQQQLLATAMYFRVGTLGMTLVHATTSQAQMQMVPYAAPTLVGREPCVTSQCVYVLFGRISAQGHREYLQSAVVDILGCWRLGMV